MTLPRFHDIPAFSPADLANPAGFVRKLEQLREQVQLIIGTRGPGRGNPAWFQLMLDSGLLDPNGNPIPGPPGSGDNTPPPAPENFTVTPGINHVFVKFDAPTYSQGSGNALTKIYGASQDPTDPAPDPTFGDAVLLATVPFGTEVYALPTEPNVEWHIWVSFVSYANVEGPPAGGLHGQSCVSGQLDGAVHIEALTVTHALIALLAVDDANIANCNVGKLVAGSLSVGEYIQSSGFVSGFTGFRISGNGNAELNNAIFRGLIEADSGLIGGAVIDTTGVESSNYNGTSLGWRLDNATGILTAFDVNLYGAFSGDIELPPFTADIPEGDFVDDVANGLHTYDTFTSDVDAGTGPFEYLWLLVNITSDNDNSPWGVLIDGDPTDDTVVVKGFGTDNVVIANLLLLVTDANGRVAKKIIHIAATHGTPP